MSKIFSAVFEEIFRVLGLGGRICISDVLRSGPMPEELKNDPAAYSGWVSGAISPDEVKTILGNLGFDNISITPKAENREIIQSWNKRPSSRDRREGWRPHFRPP